jgi:O-antigen ligase
MIRHWVVPLYLLACLLLGGASAAGLIANLLLQLAALPLIGWSLWHLIQSDGVSLSRSIRAVLALLALLLTVALIQMIPLPPAIWTTLPGRGPVVEGYRLLGVALPWLPLTLAPEGARASLLWLLPAIATLLTMVATGAFRGRGIAWAIVAVTLASVAIGALQLLGGESAYLYAITNHGVAVGFFANANHNATLLLVCIPFLTALQTTLLKRSTSPRSASAVRLLVAAGYAVILVGLLTNGSLAGLGLGVPVVMVTWLSFGRQRPALRRGLLVATGLLSAAVIAFIAISPSNNLFGVQHDNIELSRQTSFALTLRAAGEYFPIGSGIGSFQPVYRTQEPLSTVTTTFMNHAHSDWIELLLETGLAGVALAAAFLVWWGLRVRATWQADEREPFAQAAAIASAAIMLHSIVDYPLRTATLSAVFAMCIGLLSGARPYVRRNRAISTARHLSL